MAMQVVPPALDRLIRDLAKLPGIGQKTATRLALYILRRPSSEARSLVENLASLHSSIKLCSSCFAFSESDPCSICGDARRNNHLVCVVEEPGDLLSIEKTGAFRGVYHILHGVLSPMDGIGPKEIKIRELCGRIENGDVEEILPPAPRFPVKQRLHFSWIICGSIRFVLPALPAEFQWAWTSNMLTNIPLPVPLNRDMQ